MNVLTKLLEIKYPIISAPMAGVSGGRLAQAVSKAGGLGLIGVGYSDLTWLEQELKWVKECAFGAGFITWKLKETPQLLERVLQEKPIAVMLSFGDPQPFIDSIKKAGAKVICQVQTVKDAKKAKACGADIIVAQGAEAGGHGLSRGTFALVPAVIDAVHPIPVVAAGGIADGRGLAAALTLGATGVLIGTRFYACTESVGDSKAKEMLTTASGDETVRSNIFDYARGLDWPAPFTARTLQNLFTQKWQQAALDKIDATEQKRYQEATKNSDFSISGIFAGEDVDLIHEILPAEAIIKKIIKEAQQIFSEIATRSPL